MKLEDLPLGNPRKTLDFDHFPTRWQAFVWRNRIFFSDAKLARLLGCDADTVRQAAVAMGLPEAAAPDPAWLANGYLTIIRNNWHLLNYPQLLELLEWPPEKLAHTLKEEDFLWTKMGLFKPECPQLKYTPLTPAQQQQTARLKHWLRRNIPFDTMTPQEKPFEFTRQYHPQPSAPGHDRFELNLIHSYAASCGDVFIDLESQDPLPENLLSQYASLGIRGIWVHALLYLLHPIDGAEEYSTGYEQRLHNLQTLVDRCAGYGIGLYLYLDEPRGMPLSFYQRHPAWRGVKAPRKEMYTNCTGNPAVTAWLETACRSVFQKVHGLAGVFLITMSENPTYCNYGWGKADCPHCRDRAAEELISEIVTVMERGIHAAAPEARILVYDWAWRQNPEDVDTLEFRKKVIDRLPSNVWLMSVSEWNQKIQVGGIPGFVSDYSISQVGPSAEAAAAWQYAKKRGLKVAAKVQINNSWELSAVPYLPVPYLLEEHLQNLTQAGVDGLMLSWTLGGYPGGNLELLRKTPAQIAEEQFSPQVAPAIRTAWRQFSEAFRQFPFSMLVIYMGPMNYGPMNLLFAEPTGYQASMIGFPYDDLTSWRHIYPEEIFEEQFRLLTNGWRRGLAELDRVKTLLTPADVKPYRELNQIAVAAFCHFQSTLEQIRFVRARQRQDLPAMIAAIQSELALARRLYELQQVNSKIGFEASNHYYYTQQNLLEKILNCEFLLEKFQSSAISS